MDARQYVIVGCEDDFLIIDEVILNHGVQKLLGVGKELVEVRHQSGGEPSDDEANGYSKQHADNAYDQAYDVEDAIFVHS